MHMKNSSHSISHGSKCRLSQLKKVKAYKFNEKNESWHSPGAQKQGAESRKPLQSGEIYFLLDW